MPITTQLCIYVAYIVSVQGVAYNRKWCMNFYKFTELHSYVKNLAVIMTRWLIYSYLVKAWPVTVVLLPTNNKWLRQISAVSYLPLDHNAVAALFATWSSHVASAFSITWKHLIIELLRHFSAGRFLCAVNYTKRDIFLFEGLSCLTTILMVINHDFLRNEHEHHGTAGVSCMLHSFFSLFFLPFAPSVTFLQLYTSHMLSQLILFMYMTLCNSHVFSITSTF
jgi:hypothetical protein